MDISIKFAIVKFNLIKTFIGQKIKIANVIWFLKKYKRDIL